MPIKLIRGPIGSGKTRGMIDFFVSSPSCIYIAPSEHAASSIRKTLLERCSNASLLGDVSISWSKFIHKIANPSDHLLSRFQVSLLLMKVISENHLNYFKTKNASLGIAKQFADTILALKRNGIDTMRLRNILDTRGGIKENDLLTTFERFESTKEKLGVLDEGDLHRISLASIEAGDIKYLSGISHLLLDEFHSFSPGQLQILNAIRTKLPKLDIQISCPSSTDDDSLYANYLESNFANLSKIADDIVEYENKHYDPPTIDIGSARSPLQEVRFTLESLSSITFDTNISKDQLVLVSRSKSTLLCDIISEAQYLDIGDGLIERGNLDAPVLHELLSSEVIDRWPPEGRMDQFIDLCLNFISSKDIIDRWTDKLKASTTGGFDLSRSLSAVSRLDATLQELAVVSNFFELPPIRRENFTRMLLDKFTSESSHLYTERRLPFTHVPFESGLTTSASHVVIPRMLEGNIPRFQEERLFFSESDKLSPDPDNVLDKIFTNSEDALAVEAYLFDTFLNKCSERLILSYPIIDDGGAETTKSSFLDAYQDQNPIESIEMKSSAELQKDWTKRRDELVETERERFRGSAENSPHAGHLTSTSAKELIRKRFQTLKFSATSLEKYAACPFTFFVEKVLGLEPKEEEMPELIPKDRGTILHAVLEIFYKDHLNLFQEYISTPALRSDVSRLVDKIIGEVFEEYEKIISGVAIGLKDKQRQMIKTMAMQVIEMEVDQARQLPTPLSPFKCEWGFGENDVPDLTIPIKNDIPAMIHGWIDRIDVDKDKTKFLVVDYKTRTAAKSVKHDILSGLKLQLPIYVEAVRRLLLPNALPLGGLLIDVLTSEKRHGFIKKEFNEIYYTVGRSHSSMTDEIWDQAITAAISACSVYVANIRDGIFDVAPKNGCPGYCDYAEICRYYGQGSN